MKRRIAAALIVSVALTAHAAAPDAQATPAQAKQIRALKAKVVKQGRTVAKQRQTIAVLRARPPAVTTVTVPGPTVVVPGPAIYTTDIGALTPDQAWGLVAQIAEKLKSAPYSSSLFTSTDDFSQYDSWTLTRAYFGG